MLVARASLKLSEGAACIQVKLCKSDKIQLLPNQSHEPSTYDSIEGRVAQIQEGGYYGGVRLLMVGAFLRIRNNLASVLQ